MSTEPDQPNTDYLHGFTDLGLLIRVEPGLDHRQGNSCLNTNKLFRKSCSKKLGQSIKSDPGRNLVNKARYQP